jgi:hypothetical protein
MVKFKFTLVMLQLVLLSYNSGNIRSREERKKSKLLPLAQKKEGKKDPKPYGRSLITSGQHKGLSIHKMDK